MIDPVKILDFGLAKQRADESPGGGASEEHSMLADIKNEETILYSFAKKYRKNRKG